MSKLIFLFTLLVLFALELLQPVQQYFVLPFTQAQASLSAMILSVFDNDVVSSGIILRSISHGTAVSIQSGCNGLEALICLVAAIFAFSSTWQQKVIGLVIGFIAIQSLNLMRIISLFYLLQWDRQWFDWAHLYAWQVLIFLDVLIVFIIWIRWVSSENKIASDQQIVANAK